ncbi:arylalkylamine N-acetyltransferase 1-like isoform X2 [Condylostylus longicornis]|uniref:arylalkylamine N-acetyltransferase 1-like isoform X2 n=1 Tax=Condylostylus longicornis TaxID=2530218 RepID=UPI00244E2C73|nr:arylalkylamine N-acetyltransferase 1-like isoform X2 [Condylostylus longicornis]
MDMIDAKNMEHQNSYLENNLLLQTPLLTISELHSISRLSQAMEKKPKVTERIIIERVTEKDAVEVIALLKKFFFKDEPLNKAIDLGECKELEEYSLKCIPDKCSFKAVNTNGKIIGVFLNGILKKPDPNAEPISLAEKCAHKKFKIIMSLMDYIDSKFNIFDLYPNADTILDGKIVSVDDEYRGCGIAGQLTEATLDYLKQNNIPVMHVMCSSHFSARVMEKLGFHEVYSLDYNDFLINGEVVLKPEPPHKSCRILVKEV